LENRKDHILTFFAIDWKLSTENDNLKRRINMKRTIIGCMMVSCGVMIVSSIFIAAAIFAPSMTSWSGSKLWFAIFGARQFGNEAVQSLFIGIPFIIGLLMVAAGLLISAVEYVKGDKNN